MQFAAWSASDKCCNAVIPNGGHGCCKRIGSAVVCGNRLLGADELTRLAGLWFPLMFSAPRIKLFKVDLSATRLEYSRSAS